MVHCIKILYELFYDTQQKCGSDSKKFVQRIECMFRELKQQTSAFCYHFWSKYMPKLSRYQQKGNRHLWSVWKAKSPARKCWRLSVPLRCIWPFPASRWGSCRAFPSVISGKSVPARSVTRGRRLKRGFPKQPLCTIFGNIFRLLGQNPELCITQIIQELQGEPEEQWDSLVP